MGKLLPPLVVAIVIGIGIVKAGEESAGSILGMPPARDRDRPGAVMLHGGGRITDDAFARFVELAGGKEARIVLVPSAGYRRADYSTESHFSLAVHRRYGSWFRLAETGAARSVTLLHTDDPADADGAAFTRPLASATGVWFTGGSQARLNYRYVGSFPVRTRFQEAVRDVVARGGVVGGTSAGMAAMPEIMALSESRKSAGGPVELVAAHGLGLLDGAIVEQHFDSRGGRMERFTGLLRESARLDRLAGRRGAGAKMIGVAVEGSTAAVLRADRLETIGSGSVHVFLKSPDDRTISWHALKAGESASLGRDDSGRVALTAGR